MIQDTAYDLELHLRRIDEKMTRLNIENASASVLSIDQGDEREVTKQCLRICEDARSYIESLSNRESSILPEAPQNENSFEAQLQTRQALDKNQDTFAKTISYLQKRLESLVQNDGPEKDDERSRLQADIEISKQCLDVCEMASKVSHQKVYKTEEVIADSDSDQVVVTTLADLFDIKKALFKNSSAQLVGLMTEDSLRYLSRFGALASDSDPAKAGTISSPAIFEVQKSKHASAPQTLQRKHEVHESNWDQKSSMELSEPVDQMKLIEKKMLSVPAIASGHAEFVIFWELPQYLHECSDDESDFDIGNVITVCGSGLEAWGGTCGEYFSRTWKPRSWNIIELLRKAEPSKYTSGGKRSSVIFALQGC
jgi:Fungal N-terminal domain of STAND proteins